MSSTMPQPEYTTIGGNIRIPRIINGLWQLAGGHDPDIDVAEAAACMKPLIDAGLNCFDMADHYGSAELVIGQHHRTSEQPIVAFTKWCPVKTDCNSLVSKDAAEAAVKLSLDRMNTAKILLLQFHPWDYTDPAYLRNLSHLFHVKGKVEHIGITNVDGCHLKLLHETGFKIATNQVSCSVLDTRIQLGDFQQICRDYKVRILAYGTLLGGFISEKWLGQPEPTDLNSLNWSLRKYSRFIKEAGGWEAFQVLLRVLNTVAGKHQVSIPAIAVRHVLDLPEVAAVIVGTRLSKDSEPHIRGILEAFSFSLDPEDEEAIRAAQEKLKKITRGCGDEYRRPPFLTAAGDLSDHFSPSQHEQTIKEAIEKGTKLEYHDGDTDSWRDHGGYHAVRRGNAIQVCWTTARSPVEGIPVVGGKCAYSQTVAVLDIIERALKYLGSSLADVVETEIIIRYSADDHEVRRALWNVFGAFSEIPTHNITSGRIGHDEHLRQVYPGRFEAEEYLVQIRASAEAGESKAG